MDVMYICFRLSTLMLYYASSDIILVQNHPQVLIIIILRRRIQICDSENPTLKRRQHLQIEQFSLYFLLSTFKNHFLYDINKVHSAKFLRMETWYELGSYSRHPYLTPDFLYFKYFFILSMRYTTFVWPDITHHLMWIEWHHLAILVLPIWDRIKTWKSFYWYLINYFY